MELVCVDLGGTNVRFAVANVAAGRVASLGDPVTLHTGDYAGLDTAWGAYARMAGRGLPRAASLAVACPIAGDVLKLTNSAWILRPATLAAELGVDQLTLVNDFGAVGHAVAQLPPEHLRHIAGPDTSLPAEGVIGILGPGTGLGVAHVLRAGGTYHVMETEGGHVDFAPVDSIEDAILQRLRQRFLRVSAERIVSGPGLANIHAYLAELEGKALGAQDDKTLWAAALEGSDRLAASALERFCLCLGSVAGDLALAQGAQAMVIGGGVGARIADVLPRSGFAGRFTAKGRMGAMLATLPVKLITHPEPGLFGAAAAFARAHTAGGAHGMRRAIAAVLLAAGLAGCTPGPAPTLSRSAQDDLGRVSAYLNALPRFEAHFSQSGDYGPGAGLVWVDRPGRLRIDYAGAASRVMVIAGGRVRVLDRGNGAVTTMPVSRTPLGILLDAPLHLDGAVTVDSLVHTGDTLRLTLSKTGAPAQGLLTLDFSDRPLALQAVSVTDAYRRVLTMRLSGIDKAPVLTPELFAAPAS